ncbi:Predicted mechanosensitive ion channel [Phaffia rhodozyma]|uniref:Predicted mechanosensitive ion channel n=1 Tax=Phaffia rhodozyma TaxID=264483 RepID=A0A0F7SKL7_PHARH|nr:Predicted mechanosensitive ion channel [Phaffia rhodozyma]
MSSPKNRTDAPSRSLYTPTSTGPARQPKEYRRTDRTDHSSPSSSNSDPNTPLRMRYNDNSLGNDLNNPSAYSLGTTDNETHDESGRFQPDLPPQNQPQSELQPQPWSSSNRSFSVSPTERQQNTDENAFRLPGPSYMEPIHPGTSDDTPSDGTASDHTDDEFDWDVDDEINHDQAKTFEALGGGTSKAIRARRGRRVYLWFKGLSRWFRAFMSAFIGCTILMIPFIVVMTEFKNNPAKSQVQTWSLFLTISWAIGCALNVLVDFLPHLFTMLIMWISGKVPENLKTYVELMLAVSTWVKIFVYSVDIWVTLSVTRAAISPSGSYWVYINRVAQAIFAASILLLTEKVLLQIIAINFHRKALKDRLTLNAEALRALDKLSKAIRTFPTSRLRGAHKRGKSGNISSSRTNSPFDTPGSIPGTPFTRPGTPSTESQPIDFAPHHQQDHNSMTTTTVRPSPLSRQTDVSELTVKAKGKKKSAAKVVTGLGRQIKDIAMEGMFGKGPEIGSLASARQLARKLFEELEYQTGQNARGITRHTLTVDDFLPYFRSQEDAQTAFAHFDQDGNGDLSKREMRGAVQRIYRERKALTASLADMSSAIGKMDGVLLGVALIICVFVFLLIFNKSSTVTSLVPVCTFVVGFSFIFANTAKTLFESLIFIFATHPFDVGDLVLIDTDYLFVKEFGLVSTTFRRVDNQEIIAPNALLASAKLIHNIRRSRAMWEVISIQIAYDTPLEVIEDLNVRVKQYLMDNNREWGGSHQLNINNISQQNAIYIDIAIEHKSNWHDWGARWARRTAFMKNLKTTLEVLEMTYSLPVQPIILPSGSEDLAAFGRMTSGGNNMMGDMGNSNGMLSPSPFPSGFPSAGGRPPLSVNTFAR